MDKAVEVSSPVDLDVVASPTAEDLPVNVTTSLEEAVVSNGNEVKRVSDVSSEDKRLLPANDERICTESAKLSTKRRLPLWDESVFREEVVVAQNCVLRTGTSNLSGKKQQVDIGVNTTFQPGSFPPVALFNWSSLCNDDTTNLVTELPSAIAHVMCGRKVSGFMQRVGFPNKINLRYVDDEMTQGRELSTASAPPTVPRIKKIVMGFAAPTNVKSATGSSKISSTAENVNDDDSDKTDVEDEDEQSQGKKSIENGNDSDENNSEDDGDEESVEDNSAVGGSGDITPSRSAADVGDGPGSDEKELPTFHSGFKVPGGPVECGFVALAATILFTYGYSDLMTRSCQITGCRTVVKEHDVGHTNFLANLRRHYHTLHQVSPLYRCDTCECGITTNENLVKHWRVDEGNQSDVICLPCSRNVTRDEKHGNQFDVFHRSLSDVAMAIDLQLRYGLAYPCFFPGCNKNIDSDGAANHYATEHNAPVVMLYVSLESAGKENMTEANCEKLTEAEFAACSAWYCSCCRTSEAESGALQAHIVSEEHRLAKADLIKDHVMIAARKALENVLKKADGKSVQLSNGPGRKRVAGGSVISAEPEYSGGVGSRIVKGMGRKKLFYSDSDGAEESVGDKSGVSEESVTYMRSTKKSLSGPSAAVIATVPVVDESNDIGVLSEDKPTATEILHVQSAVDLPEYVLQARNFNFGYGVGTTRFCRVCDEILECEEVEKIEGSFLGHMLRHMRLAVFCCEDGAELMTSEDIHLFAQSNTANPHPVFCNVCLVSAEDVELHHNQPGHTALLHLFVCDYVQAVRSQEEIRCCLPRCAAAVDAVSTTSVEHWIRHHSPKLYSCETHKERFSDVKLVTSHLSKSSSCDICCRICSVKLINKEKTEPEKHQSSIKHVQVYDNLRRAFIVRVVLLDVAKWCNEAVALARFQEVQRRCSWIPDRFTNVMTKKEAITATLTVQPSAAKSLIHLGNPLYNIASSSKATTISAEKRTRQPPKKQESTMKSSLILEQKRLVSSKTPPPKPAVSASVHSISKQKPTAKEKLKKSSGTSPLSESAASPDETTAAKLILPVKQKTKLLSKTTPGAKPLQKTTPSPKSIKSGTRKSGNRRRAPVRACRKLDKKVKLTADDSVHVLRESTLQFSTPHLASRTSHGTAAEVPAVIKSISAGKNMRVKRSLVHEKDLQPTLPVKKLKTPSKCTDDEKSTNSDFSLNNIKTEDSDEICFVAHKLKGQQLVLRGEMPSFITSKHSTVTLQDELCQQYVQWVKQAGSGCPVIWFNDILKTKKITVDEACIVGKCNLFGDAGSNSDVASIIIAKNIGVCCMPGCRQTCCSSASYGKKSETAVVMWCCGEVIHTRCFFHLSKMSSCCPGPLCQRKFYMREAAKDLLGNLYPKSFYADSEMNDFIFESCQPQWYRSLMAAASETTSGKLLQKLQGYLELISNIPSTTYNALRLTPAKHQDYDEILANFCEIESSSTITYPVYTDAVKCQLKATDFSSSKQILHTVRMNIGVCAFPHCQRPVTRHAKLENDIVNLKLVGLKLRCGAAIHVKCLCASMYISNICPACFHPDIAVHGENSEGELDFGTEPYRAINRALCLPFVQHLWKSRFQMASIGGFDASAFDGQALRTELGFGKKKARQNDMKIEIDSSLVQVLKLVCEDLQAKAK